MELEKKKREYIGLLEKSVESIVRKLSGRAEKIIVFGSYYRRRDLFTDLDVIVVMKTNKPFLERLKEIYSTLSLPVDADILCYTPEEFERMKERGFFKKLMKEAVAIYEEESNRRRKKVA